MASRGLPITYIYWELSTKPSELSGIGLEAFDAACVRLMNVNSIGS